jgi:hypothetical protein
MRNQKHVMLLAGVCLLVVTLGTSRAEVTLSLLDSNTSLSNLTITPGQSFSLNAVVAGVTSPSLATYALEIATLPPGVTLSSFTETLPPGWENFANDPASRRYGALTFEGPFITGNATLVRANFTTPVGLAQGGYTINFVAPNPGFQELRDDTETAIPYTGVSFALNVVPEPSTAALILIGAAVMLWMARRRSQPARSFKRD